MKSLKSILSLTIIMLVLISPMSVFAQWDKCLHFTWYEHDRVVVYDTPQLWPGQINAGTVEMWFKPDTIFKADTHDPDYTYLFCKNISGNYAGDMGIHWWRGYGELISFIQSGDAANLPTQDLATERPVWEPRWYHIAFVWDTEDSMRQFINGVQCKELEPNTPGELCLPVSNGPQMISIGTGAQDHWDDRYETWRGCIDEVRISATARYTADFDVATEPFEVDAYTLALWHFDEGEGEVAYDAGGYGFTGTLGTPDSAGYALPEWVDVERDPRVIINEFLADPATDANGDGTVSATADQFVELVNVSSNAIDLTGWTLGDDSAQDFQFPGGYTLQPSEFVVVFGGGDVSAVTGYNADALQSKVLVADGTIGDGLASDGDYVVLKSASGVEDAYVAFGTKKDVAPVVDGVEWEFGHTTSANAANDNSITRFPDAEFEAEDCFAEHQTAAAINYSPGKTIDDQTSLRFNLTIIIEPAGAGTVALDSVSAEKQYFSYGDFLNLTATPEKAWIFDSWSGDEEATTNPVYFSMNRSKTVTANFIPAFQQEVTIIINEVNADPDTDPILGDANRDGVRHAGQDEYIELLNISLEPVDMSGWKVGDDEQLSFTFPEGYILPSGEFVTIFGGGDLTVGAVGYNSDPLLTRAFLSDSSEADQVGNGLPNAGECIVLINRDTSYAMYMNYGSHFGNGAPTKNYTENIYFNMRMEADVAGDQNCSITRVDEGSRECQEFALHTDLVEDENSPSMSVTMQTSVTITAIEDKDPTNLPETFKLYRNFPNPFNPSTTIQFYTPKKADISLTIYNMRGEKVTELTNKEYNAGTYEVNWNGKDSRGQQVPTGVYLYSINVNGQQKTNKMVLIK